MLFKKKLFITLVIFVYTSSINFSRLYYKLYLILKFYDDRKQTKILILDFFNIRVSSLIFTNTSINNFPNDDHPDIVE